MHPLLQAAGLEKLVEYNRKKQEEVHLQELKGNLSESIIADPPLPVAESIRIVQDAKKEWQLPDTEIIKVLLIPCLWCLLRLLTLSLHGHGCMHLFWLECCSC